MPGAQVDPLRASAVLTLGDHGYGESLISRSLQMAKGTVHDILHGVGHWGEWAESPVHKQWRFAQSQALEASARAVAAVAIEQTLEAMPKASALQAATIYAIMVDKSRLLAGESTANVAIDLQVHAVDDLAGILSQALLVNPVDNSQVK